MIEQLCISGVLFKMQGFFFQNTGILKEDTCISENKNIICFIIDVNLVVMEFRSIGVCGGKTQFSRGVCDEIDQQRFQRGADTIHYK